MKLGIFSDNHGSFRIWDVYDTSGVDAWICCGDFFPDVIGYGEHGEGRRQREWFNPQRDSFLENLRGKPLLWCHGNHDEESLYRLLKYRYPITEVKPEGVDFMGLKVAGFGNTPLCTRQFDPGGEFSLKTLSEAVANSGADIVVTHAPCSQYLCADRPEWGIMALHDRIPDSVKYHFHGHIHQDGGKSVTHPNGRVTMNAARKMMLVDM